MKKTTKLALSILIALTVHTPLMAQSPPISAKNVILLIADGAGLQTWHAASFYRHGALGHEVYDKFDVKLFASTYPLNTSTKPTKSLENSVNFDTAQLWNNQPTTTEFKGRLSQYPNYFQGYQYATSDFTDSSAAATALASGYKTYNSAVNWSNNDTPLKHIGEYVVESGRALAVISSVPWSHATPAGFLAHNPNRNNYAQIAQEIVNSGLATVVMGAGHPYYDNNGRAIEPTEDRDFRFVGGKALWEKLVAGKTAYKLIETKQDFEALAQNQFDLQDKSKILGTAQNNATLQFSRSGQVAGSLLTNQPSLATMATGALNVASRNPNGFFLMVEGGAVDWAAHANNLPRLIEEQIEFNLAVEAVVNWVEQQSSWAETLVIVTTDHGNGLLQGPDSDKNLYTPILNQGAGALPLVRWHSDNHTRELVPVYAKGAGANLFKGFAKAEPGLGQYYNVPAASQFYIDNTHIFDVATKALNIKTDKD